MKEETTKPVEPELVDEPKNNIEKLRQQPASRLTDLAELEEGKGDTIIKQQHQILRTLRWASIQETMPQDWLLFKDPEGNVTGYLQDKGCQRIAPLWGIEVYPKQNEPYLIGDKSKDEHGNYKEEWGYAIDGESFCKRTDEAIGNLTGARYSTDDFLQGKKGLKADEYLKGAARANLDGKHIRRHTGLNSVPVEELEQAWQANPATKGKSSKNCVHGKGFGSKAERMGAKVQESATVPAGFEPLCQGCSKAANVEVPMKFVSAGTTQQGKPYDAFWACPKRIKEHKGISHTEVIEKLKQEGVLNPDGSVKTAAPTADQRESGQEG